MKNLFKTKLIVPGYRVTPKPFKVNYSTATEQAEHLKGNAEKREFQAETRMLLDIVARSLYSDKEVSIKTVFFLI